MKKTFLKDMKIVYLLLATLLISPLVASEMELEFMPLSSGNMAWRQKNPTSEDVILFIHGNSLSGKVFENQLNSRLLRQRLISVDLPGHGSSDNATSEETYSFEGYAKSVIEFIDRLELEKKTVILCGWSLGGHVAIEILRLRPDLVSRLLLTGAPPIDLNEAGFSAGFNKIAGMELMAKEQFTGDDVEKFIGLLWPNPKEYMLTDAARAHGIARSRMIADALSGKGKSQKVTIENAEIPLAFVLGASDPGINNEHIKNLLYRQEPQMHELQCGHDTFWGPSEQFNPLLNIFANGYKLRLIRESDNNSIKAVILNAIRTMLESAGCGVIEGRRTGTRLDEPNSLNNLYSTYNDEQRAKYFVAEKAGQVVGGGGFAPIGDTNICELQTLYVTDQRQGVGGALLVKVLSEAAKFYNRCYLETMPKMFQARKLYIKMGFKPSQKISEENHGDCSIYMIKDLKMNPESEYKRLMGFLTNGIEDDDYQLGDMKRLIRGIPENDRIDVLVHASLLAYLIYRNCWSTTPCQETIINAVWNIHPAVRSNFVNLIVRLTASTEVVQDPSYGWIKNVNYLHASIVDSVSRVAVNAWPALAEQILNHKPQNLLEFDNYLYIMKELPKFPAAVHVNDIPVEHEEIFFAKHTSKRVRKRVNKAFAALSVDRRNAIISHPTAFFTEDMEIERALIMENMQDLSSEQFAAHLLR